MAYEILVPKPGIKPMFPMLAGRFLIMGSPGKSLVAPVETFLAGYFALAFARPYLFLGCFSFCLVVLYFIWYGRFLHFVIAVCLWFCWFIFAYSLFCLLRFRGGKFWLLTWEIPFCDFGKGNGSSNSWPPSQETAEEFLGEVFCLRKNLLTNACNRFINRNKKLEMA